MLLAADRCSLGFVHDIPLLASLLDDSVPRSSPKAFLFGSLTAAPRQYDVGHDLLQFLGYRFPHQHENCRLRDDQVLRAFERDLHSSFAEEQRVVPNPRLHRQVLDVGSADLPRLIIHARRLGHRRARPGRYHPAALDLPAFDRGRREVQADVGALLPLFGSDEHAVTDHDQTLGGFVRHGVQYTIFPPLRGGGRWRLGEVAPPASFSDVDHLHRLTGLGASLLMRPCRRGSRGPHPPFHAEGTKTCKTRLARLRRSSGAGFCRRYGAGSGPACPGSSIGRRSFSERCSSVIPSGRSWVRLCCSSSPRWCSSRASGVRWSRSTRFRFVPVADVFWPRCSCPGGTQSVWRGSIGSAWRASSWCSSAGSGVCSGSASGCFGEP